MSVSRFSVASRLSVSPPTSKPRPAIVSSKSLFQAEAPTVEHVLVVQRTGQPVTMVEGRDHWWEALCAAEAETCEPERMNAEDPLFILYTSGSTGKPKGVLHTSGGYLVFVAMTHQYVFDYHDGDIYWCTADVGWVTGHSYIVYGPLANGATTLMFEGVPNYPTASRFWDVVDKHKVNIFYTAPTAIRALMREGEAPVKKHDRSSLRILGSVGEPINPEAWLWYYRVVGEDGEMDTEREDYERSDFKFTTGNKQLNFMQHIMTVMSAATVAPALPQMAAAFSAASSCTCIAPVKLFSAAGRFSVIVRTAPVVDSRIGDSLIVPSAAASEPVKI